MVTVYQVSDVFSDSSACTEIKEFFRAPFKPIAWCYLQREGSEPGLLVGERYKKNDPARRGQLVVPGGGIKKGEDNYAAAVRECEEETGVVANATTRRTFSRLVSDPIFKTNGSVQALITPADGNPEVWVAYTDTGKKYRCSIVELLPSTMPSREPTEMAGSDLRKPLYMPIREILNKRREFTAAVQILIGMMDSAFTSKPIVEDDDVVICRNAALWDYLQTAEGE